MEEFKKLSDILQVDERHVLLSAINGEVFDIEPLHQHLSEILLNDSAPEEIKDGFNIAKNMALYTYYFYALAPEVQLKTYSIIEYALKIKYDRKTRKGLKFLLKKAVYNSWITDKGFRHIPNPNKDNPCSKSLIDTIPDLRNHLAHGHSDIYPQCIGHIEKCADFVNQLYP